MTSRPRPVTVASVAVNIVTLNYVILARVLSLLPLSIIMAFRVLNVANKVTWFV